jgi:hypothetical protein
MNDEPPRPPDEQPAEPSPPSSRPDAFSPIKESRGTRGMEALGLGCLGFVSFILAAAIFMVIISANQSIGLLVAAAMVVGLIGWRTHVGPSPKLGAVVVGAGIALLITGTCTVILMNTDFR